MKKTLLQILAGIAFLGVMAAPGFAQGGHGEHQAGAAEKSASALMPMKGGEEMKGMPCMAATPSLAGRLDLMT